MIKLIFVLPLPQAMLIFRFFSKPPIDEGVVHALLKNVVLLYGQASANRLESSLILKFESENFVEFVQHLLCVWSNA